MKFLDYEIKKYIVSALKDIHFKEFTNVQKKVFENINKNKNLLVKSKTGSGKTHSFLVPIFNDLNEEEKKVQAVIISPTTELAAQTYKFAQHIASFSDKEIKIKIYSGGTDRQRELENLKSGQPQIVIATPGKIKDLAITSNELKIYTAKYYVVDEFDMILDDGFSSEIDEITEILNSSIKMFFSATLSESLQPFVKKYLNNPIFINLDNDKQLDIEHVWIPLKYRSKEEMLDNLLDVINPYLCIIFCNKKADVINIYKHLKEQNKECQMIQGDMSLRERKHVFKEASKLKYQYIVASDIASRGIDIDGVSHIINFDLPNNFEFYLHRSGRTGRMNYSGIVYSFYKDIDSDYLDFLNKNGINPIYKTIKNRELVDFKGRNTRKKRVKPLNATEKSAIAHVSKPKKVTPGYKKKMKRKIDDITGKLYKNKNYRMRNNKIKDRKKNRGN